MLCFKCNNKGHYANECLEKKAEEAAKANALDKGYGNHIKVEENSNQDLHAKPNKKDLSLVECFKCKEMGHYSRSCPEKKNRIGTKPIQFQKGHVFSVNMVRVLKKPDPIIEELMINSYPAVVLFDIEATHSFISKDFVSKNKIPTRGVKRPIRVSSIEGKTLANTVCQNMTLGIDTNNFPSDLFVLELQSFDIIIGKDWMSKYDGQIDQASKMVMLTIPEKKQIMYQFKTRNEDNQRNSMRSSTK